MCMRGEGVQLGFTTDPDYRRRKHNWDILPNPYTQQRIAHLSANSLNKYTFNIHKRNKIRQNMNFLILKLADINKNKYLC